jgi:hypothetical protein
MAVGKNKRRKEEKYGRDKGIAAQAAGEPKNDKL